MPQIRPFTPSMKYIPSTLTGGTDVVDASPGIRGCLAHSQDLLDYLSYIPGRQGLVKVIIIPVERCVRCFSQRQAV